MLFKRQAKQRSKLNEVGNNRNYPPVQNFRELEVVLRDVQYPDNLFNKTMSMILSDVELFHFITQRFSRDRNMLSIISSQDNYFRFLGKNERSFPAHPLEKTNQQAIKVDVQSLFIFGMILVNRSLLLLGMFLPDKSTDPKKDMYSKIGLLYRELVQNTNLSPLAVKFKTEFLPKIKWLNAALRFYRNEFIEHLDRAYQQGTTYGVVTSDFALTSYKWDYNTSDDLKIEAFRTKLELHNIHIPGRTGPRSLVNRYYVQKMFDNINQIPDDLMSEALDIIEDIGVHSPQPAQVISEVESYIVKLFQFMINEVGNSELAKYKKP